MKATIYFLFLSLVVLSFSAGAQGTKLEGFFPSTGNDSVRIYYNSNYMLITDSCADIIRYCRYDIERRTFKGRFKDVSKFNPANIVAIGSYDENGMKQGQFVSYYPNGSMQAKGSFKNDNFDGKWELFYESGDPKITFLVNGDGVQIMNAWNEEGKKTIDNGYGDYQAVNGALTWAGKLVGGKPDGKWILKRAFHSEVLVTERFKLGEFQKGTNQVGEYKDSSRIELISKDLLPVTKAEKFWMANGGCGDAPKKSVATAWYSGGREKFAEEIKDRLAPILNDLHLSPFNEPIELEGKIMENGAVVFDKTKGDSKLASALISGLHSLPYFEPAKVDGKAAKQDIIIVITYNSSVYRFSYRLKPITTN